MTVIVKQEGSEWIIYDDGIRYDYFRTEEEAEKTARLLRKAITITDDIQDCADSLISELTEKEKEFLRNHTGDKIEIEI